MRLLLKSCGVLSALLGCILVVAGVVAVCFLPGNIAEYSKEPEDVYGLVLIFLLTFPCGVLAIRAGVLLFGQRAFSLREFRIVVYPLLGYLLVYGGISLVLIPEAPDFRPDIWLVAPVVVALALILLALLQRKRFLQVPKSSLPSTSPAR